MQFLAPQDLCACEIAFQCLICRKKSLKIAFFVQVQNGFLHDDDVNIVAKSITACLSNLKKERRKREETLQQQQQQQERGNVEQQHLQQHDYQLQQQQHFQQTHIIQQQQIQQQQHIQQQQQQIRQQQQQGGQPQQFPTNQIPQQQQFIHPPNNQTVSTQFIKRVLLISFFLKKDTLFNSLSLLQTWQK